ncbi:MAG TPA: hypothetical protein VJ046_00480 [Candidatus Paceibacterota bacterium]|nr:hypothetical protein [Candidatus Paceibacterota bacterium]
MSTMSGYMAQKLLKWLVLLALVLFIVAIVIFLFGKPSFSEDDVVLELEGPTQASVGDEVVYKVKYGNQTKLELNNLKFKFTYPEESVVLKDDEILKELSETFTVDNLQDGGSGEKEFRAFLVGDRGNIKQAKVELEFRAGTIRSSFEKSDTISTTLVSVPVSLTLVAPPSVVSGQTINYIFDYRNESSDNISDIRFEFTYPDGFAVQERTPAPTGTNTWSVPLLRRGAGGRINIKGTLGGKEGEVKTVSVLLKRGINGEFVNYQKAATSSLISNPLLGLDVFVNGSKDYSAHLGDRLQYTVRYRNNSTSNLIGLNLEVKLEGEMYDIETLDTDGGFYDSSSGTILWNAAVVSDFSALPPARSGELKFSVDVKDGFPSGGVGGRNFFVKAAAKLSTPNVPSGIESGEVAATTDLITRISTQPTLLQTAFYNDPAFGSSGPLPPKTGQETVFTVHWQIANPGNDMNSAEVKAVLPPGVNWKNVVSVGLGQSEPTFNANSSEVRWNIGVLPQGTGVLTPKYEASFQVSVKPSVVGQTPTIVKDSKFSGTDSFTKEQIILNAPDLTTNELVDRPGEGTVQ